MTEEEMLTSERESAKRIANMIVLANQEIQGLNALLERLKGMLIAAQARCVALDLEIQDKKAART